MSVLSNGKITLVTGSAIGRAIGNNGAEMGDEPCKAEAPATPIPVGARVIVNNKPGLVVEHRVGRIAGFTYGVRFDVDPEHVYLIQPDRVEDILKPFPPCEVKPERVL